MDTEMMEPKKDKETKADVAEEMPKTKDSVKIKGSVGSQMLAAMGCKMTTNGKE